MIISYLLYVNLKKLKVFYLLNLNNYSGRTASISADILSS